MKGKVAWVVSWSLYWMGDLVSRIMHITDFWFLYGPYNWFMVKSDNVQTWGQIDNGPWEAIKGKQ